MSDTISPYVKAAAERAALIGTPELKPLSIYDSQSDTEFCAAHSVDMAVKHLRKALTEAEQYSRLCPEMYRSALETLNNWHHDECPTLEYVEDQMAYRP